MCTTEVIALRPVAVDRPMNGYLRTLKRSPAFWDVQPLSFVINSIYNDVLGNDGNDGNRWRVSSENVKSRHRDTRFCLSLTWHAVEYNRSLLFTQFPIVVLILVLRNSSITAQGWYSGIPLATLLDDHFLIHLINNSFSIFKVIIIGTIRGLHG